MSFQFAEGELLLTGWIRNLLSIIWMSVTSISIHTISEYSLKAEFFRIFFSFSVGVLCNERVFCIMAGRLWNSRWSTIRKHAVHVHCTMLYICKPYFLQGLQATDWGGWGGQHPRGQQHVLLSFFPHCAYPVHWAEKYSPNTQLDKFWQISLWLIMICKALYICDIKTKFSQICSGKWL